MSLRQVLTIFNAERQLSDDDTALLNTLRKMNPSELEILSGALTPPAKSKPRKRRKLTIPLCVKCGYAKLSVGHRDQTLDNFHFFVRPDQKSARASSLQKQIAKTEKPKTDHCTFLMEINGGQEMCEAVAGDPIHDPVAGYAGYHPFVSSAPTADEQSSPSDGEASSPVGSETETVKAGAVASGED